MPDTVSSDPFHRWGPNLEASGMRPMEIIGLFTSLLGIRIDLMSKFGERTVVIRTIPLPEFSGRDVQ